MFGERFETFPGGKGANQAVAASRLGASVKLIGRVGDDVLGAQLQEKLKKEGISLDGITSVKNMSTGVAAITLAGGDNRIIVVPGANNHVTPAYVENFKEQIINSDVVLVQFEIPLETIRYCLEICHAHNVAVIVNPAPARELETKDWGKATYITPNETEAEELFPSALEKREVISSKLVITMGSKGVTYIENGFQRHLPAYKVSPVDTTGAGDTFNGAFAVAIAEKKGLSEVIRFANAAAALSVQRIGAQEGMPMRSELEEFVQTLD